MWKQAVFDRLRERNREQRDGFQRLFHAYNASLEQASELRTRNMQLEKRLSRASSSALSETGEGDAESEYRVETLKRELEAVRAELTNSYRDRAQHTAELLEFKRKLEQAERRILEKEAELAEESGLKQQLREDMAAEVKERAAQETTIALLREEIASMDRQLKEAEERIAQLEKTNRDFLQRLLELKNREASEMNDATLLLQQAAMQREMIKEQQAQLAAQALASENPELAGLSETGRGGAGALSAAGLAAAASGSPAAIIDEQAWQANFNVSIPTTASRHISAHGGDVSCVVLNGDGSRVLSAGGSSDKVAKIWDAFSGKRLATLRGCTESVTCVAFSPNERYVLGTSTDKRVRLWSMRTHRVEHTMSGHKKKVLAGTFSLDGGRIITGSHDRTVKVWDIRNGYPVQSLNCPSAINSLNVSPNGDVLACAHMSASAGISFWSLHAGECVRQMPDIHTQQVTCVAYSNDGSTLITNSRDCTLNVVDMRTYKVVMTLTSEDERYSIASNTARVAWSPDGKYVASGSSTGSLHFWDVRNGKAAKVITHSFGGGSSPSMSSRRHSRSSSVAAGPGINAVAWSRHGSPVVSCDNQGTIVFWE